jgi:hypothetical protein
MPFLPEVKRLISTKGPDDVFQPGTIYQVSSITNEIRVYKGEDLTYIEYSIKGIEAEYVLKMVQSIERWNEWNMDIKESEVIN